ncbi:hypothetical protein FLA_0037 [Filimonas lacunae]|nr:hypothetical protein FLA_0037 [Filimonas lacunae]
MKGRLDREMPVLRKKGIRGAVYGLVALFVLLCIHVKLTDSGCKPAKGGEVSFTAYSPVVDHKVAAGIPASRFLGGVNSGVSLATAYEPIEQQDIVVTHPYSIDTSVAVMAGLSLKNNQREEADSLMLLQADTSLPFVNKQQASAKKWQLFAGVSSNVVVAAKKQDMQPYPAAELRYYPGKRFFIATGLSVFSPVTAKACALKNSYSVDDTMYNVKLINENVAYRKQYYMNIPLVAGVEITDRFTISGGMQASVLLTSKQEEQTVTYDFDMQRLVNPPVNLLATPTALVPDETYDVEVRKLELRYLLKMDYRFGRLLAGVSYEHALSPLLKGQNVSGVKNNLFSIGLKYRFF